MEALSEYDAVRLFLDRARRARPSFAISDANAGAVAQICRRLDGIPLAIELAAARCRQMPVERIAHDLDDRFRLLTGGARTVLPRHQTLAASVDWSHDRLSASKQSWFRRLGVFAGPFPLQAAEAIATAPGDLDARRTFDTLSGFVDKSLVILEDGPDGEPRYRLLETLRAYALDRARAAGELSPLRDSHAAFWLRWLEDRFSVIHTDAVIEQVEAAHDNLTAALDWSAEHDPALGLRILRCLGRAWQNSGRAGDAMTAVDRVLTDDNLGRFATAWLVAACEVSLLVMIARGYPDGYALARKAEHVAATIGDPYHLATARWLSEFDADEERCIALRDLARESGDDYVEARSNIGLAWIKLNRDPVAAAAQLDSPDLVAASN